MQNRATRRIPIRRLEQERLAALQARERRRTISRKLKWSVLLLLLAAIIAGVTYGVIFAPYTALRDMLPMPSKLISVVFIVNGVSHAIPAEGTLVVHPADLVEVDDSGEVYCECPASSKGKTDCNHKILIRDFLNRKPVSYKELCRIKEIK